MPELSDVMKPLRDHSHRFAKLRLATGWGAAASQRNHTSMLMTHAMVRQQRIFR